MNNMMRCTQHYNVDRCVYLDKHASGEKRLQMLSVDAQVVVWRVWVVDRGPQLPVVPCEEPQHGLCLCHPKVKVLVQKVA